jgi:hypothetical protein
MLSRLDTGHVKAYEEAFSLARQLLELGERRAALSVLKKLDLLTATIEAPVTPVRSSPLHNIRPVFLSRLRACAYHSDFAGAGEGDEVAACFLGGFTLSVSGKEVRLPRRLQEILLLIALSPGISGEKLAAELYEDGYPRSVKVSVSKLRRHIPISTGSYEVSMSLRSDVQQLKQALTNGDAQTAAGLYRGPLLPASNAPGVMRERNILDESVKRAALASQDPELILALTYTHEEDLEVWEAALTTVTPTDLRRPVIEAQVKRIREEWAIFT